MASSHQLGSAMRRTVRSSFAYRHTSERITQHSNNRRANLQTSLLYMYLYRIKGKEKFSFRLSISKSEAKV